MTRTRNKEDNQRGNVKGRRKKKEESERQRDHLWDGGGRISYSDPQLYQKMCCSLFSRCLSSLLSFSLYLSFSPLSWPFNSLKRYREEGVTVKGGFYPLLSVSVVPAEQKHQLNRPVCVRADINNHSRLFTNDSAVNNLNSFPFGNRVSFILALFM